MDLHAKSRRHSEALMLEEPAYLVNDCSTKMYLSKEIFDHLRTSFASLAGASVNTQTNQALLEQPSVEWPWKRTRVNDAGREQHSLEFQIELRSQCAH